MNPSGGSIVPHPISHVVLQGADMAIADWQEWPHRSISSPLPSSAENTLSCIAKMQITLYCYEHIYQQYQSDLFTYLYNALPVFEQTPLGHGM